MDVRDSVPEQRSSFLKSPAIIGGRLAPAKLVARLAMLKKTIACCNRIHEAATPPMPPATSGQRHEQRLSQLQQADGLASQLDTLPAKTGAVILRRQKHAHRQFLTAVQTLVVVRRLQTTSADRGLRMALA